MKMNIKLAAASVAAAVATAVAAPAMALNTTTVGEIYFVMQDSNTSNAEQFVFDTGQTFDQFVGTTQYTNWSSADTGNPLSSNSLLTSFVTAATNAGDWSNGNVTWEVVGASVHGPASQAGSGGVVTAQSPISSPLHNGNSPYGVLNDFQTFLGQATGSGVTTNSSSMLLTDPSQNAWWLTGTGLSIDTLVGGSIGGFSAKPGQALDFYTVVRSNSFSTGNLIDTPLSGSWTFADDLSWTTTATPSVPLPPAAYLLLSGLLGIGVLARRTPGQASGRGLSPAS